MADAVFLKKESRIQALAFVMCICLLVYSIAQRKLRIALEKQKETIPNQVGKPVKNPTLKWVFQLFGCVHVIYKKAGSKVKKIISNLNDIRTKILKILGTQYLRLYDIAP